jgi:methylglutaconyl-CoA hydratase
MADEILLSIDARGVATLTLNRPHASNAFDAAMLAALDDALERIGGDGAVRAVVLRGAGRHFCSGADIRAGVEGGPDPVAVFRRLDATPKPTVALVQGACLGGGVALLAACDVAIAEDAAFFSVPEVRLGISGAPMLPLFLAALGARTLRRYALTGERFGAAAALRAGLVHEVCAAGGLEAAALPIVEDLLQGAPRATAETKRLIAALAAGGPDGSPERLAAHFAAQRDAEEAHEGRAAFRERRRPSWYPAP